MILGIILCSSFSAKSQITGTILDENNQPINFAQIVAFNNDSTAVENTQTPETGMFILVDNNISSIIISAFGYNNMHLSVKPNQNLGELKLRPSSIELKEVTVSAHRPITKLSGNTLTTYISGTYLSKLGTASDVIGWLPTVSGRNGNFYVFGKGSPDIYMNGRKITSSSELEQLSSNNIQEISVVSNPGAKYGGSVKAVINIKTKKPHGEGFGLNARLKGSFSNYFSPLGQLDLSYRTGGFDLNLIGYAAQDKKRNESFFTQDTYLPVPINEVLSQNTINNNTEYIGKITVNYQLNTHHSIGGFYRMSLNDETKSFTSISDLSKNNNSWVTMNTTGSSDKNLYMSHNSNIYYSGSIKSLHLDFNLDYFSNCPQTKTIQKEVYSDDSERTMTSTSLYSAKLLAQKFTASYELASSRFEIGEEYTNSNIRMFYNNIENIIPNNWNKTKENNIAIFAQYIHSFGQKFQVEAGLRYEHVTYNYIKNGHVSTIQNKTYNNLFPSFGASAQFGNLGLSLSYTNKTERPSYSQLDGNIHYNNRYQYQQGNPELIPVKKESLEFMAQYQPFFLQASLQNQRHPILFNAETYNNNENINLISYINGNTIKELDLIVGASLDSKNWNSQLSIGVAKQWFNTSFRESNIFLGKPIGLIKWECYVKLPVGFRLMWDYTFQTKGNMQNTFVHSHSILNLSLYKSFCNGKFDIRIAGKDLFNGNNDNIELYSGNIFINTKERFNLRSCEITLRYHLNVPKSKYKGKGAGLVEKERML